MNFDDSIAEFDFSVRTYNCLRRAGIDTAGQLATTPVKKLKIIRNLGQRSLEEIEKALEENPVSLAEGMFKRLNYVSQTPDPMFKYSVRYGIPGRTDKVVFTHGCVIIADDEDTVCVPYDFIKACAQYIKEQEAENNEV